MCADHCAVPSLYVMEGEVWIRMVYDLLPTRGRRVQLLSSE
jgi:hypothetical protein